MAKYKAVLFDMDGTFEDSRLFHIKVFVRFFEKRGIVMTIEEMEKNMAQTLDELFLKVGVPQEKIEDTLVDLRRAYVSDMDDLIFNIPLDEQAKPLFAALRERGICLGLVSNSMHLLCERIVALQGLGEYFEIILGAREGALSKEQRCHEAAEFFGASGKEVLYVGDVEGDISIAADLGFDSCLASVPYSWIKDREYTVSVLKPTYEVFELEKILSLV